MPKKIVCVEDDKTLSALLCEGLREAGFNVLSAYDGEEGLKIIEKEKPDLVLLNIMLPKINGLTVARRLKSNLQTKDIPIIILTVLANAEPLAEALESGVYEYIVKSDFKISDIIARIKEKLEKY